MRKRGELGARQNDNGTMVGGFIGPNLRLDVVNRGPAFFGLGILIPSIGHLGRKRRRKHQNVLVKRQVVNRLFLDIKSRCVEGERMGVRSDRQQHVVTELLAFIRPSATEHRFTPGRITRRDSATDGDNATAMLGEGRERLLPLRGESVKLRTIKQNAINGSKCRGIDGRSLGDLRSRRFQRAG